VRTPLADPSRDAMTQEGSENQEMLAESAQYNRWIIDRVLPWAGRRILDAGCAIGNLTRYWLDRDLVVAVEIREDFVRRIAERFGNRPNVHVFRYDLADERIRDLARFRFDTITCFNVLEHIPADERVLSHFHALLQPGGHLLLLVPACPWLYGTLDEGERHCRRYRAEELRRKVRQAGFSLRRFHYMNFPGLFGWFVNGRILRRRTLPPRQLMAYDRIIPLIAAWERRFPPLAGQSLVLAARRR
jgi:SAM-dependent methyltransferase